MRRWYLIIAGGFVVVASVVGFALLPSSSQADTAGCERYPSPSVDTILPENGTSTFSDFESVSYENGLLAIRFKSTDALRSDGSWMMSLMLLTEECDPIHSAFDYHKVQQIPNRANDFSLRFTSSISYELWDDTGNNKLEARTIPLFASFYRIRLRHQTHYIGKTGGFTSSAHTIVEKPKEPPIKVLTLPMIDGCQPFTRTGAKFDDYEHSQYVDGLLQIYFKENKGAQINGTWKFEINQYDHNCKFIRRLVVSDVSLSNAPSYWSVRFTTPTHYVIWHDDLDRPMQCVIYEKCEGELNVSHYDLDHSLIGIAGLTYDPKGGKEHPATFSSTPQYVTQTSPLDPLIVIPGIMGSWEYKGKLRMDPILHTYDNLLDNLTTNGYVLDATLFPFPYEWRDSNIQTALLLKKKIDEIKKICSCQKVDIVAHSMGGLVARQYIQSNAYQQDVDQLFFLGTPHLGAPTAYLECEGGGVGLGGINRSKKILFYNEAKEHGYGTLFDYIHGRPIASVGELLP